MHIDLRERVIVVSGGAQGIGATLVGRFVAEGARVVSLDLIAPDPTPTDPTSIDPTPQDAWHVRCDVSDEDEVRAAVAQVLERFGTIDVLVNNAGINVVGSVEDLTLAQWRRCFDVNTAGVFLLSQAVIPAMKRAGRGRILNAASFAAIVPSIGSAAYAASKAAVVQFTRVLAGELGPWGITVNAYAPGMVPSAMNGFADLPDDRRERLLDTLSLRRWETADDVGDLLCFLASDQAGYLTGTLVDVSGGKLATQDAWRAHEGRRPPAQPAG